MAAADEVGTDGIFADRIPADDPFAERPHDEEPGAAFSDNLVAQAPTVALRTIFSRFWPDTRPVRGRWVLSLLLVAATPALSAAAIWMFKILVDEVVVPHDFRRFPQLAGAYLAIAVAQGVVSFGDQYLSSWVGERFVLSLRARLFDQIHRLSAGFLERRHLGDVLSRLTGDIDAIEEVLLSGVAQALGYLFEVAWFGVALFLLDWRLAGASLVAAPLFLLAARWFSRRIKDASREKRRRAASITSVAEESFANAALVRAYGRADTERERFAEQNIGSLRAQMAATRLQAFFGPLTDLIEVVGVLAVIGLAVWELSRGRITIGGLLAFVAYLTQLYGPIQGMGRLVNSLYAAAAGAERVIEFLDEEPAVTEPGRPRSLGRASGGITLRDVGFSYPDASGPTLRGINLEIRPGERIAVVGASGAGKSTLLKLLLRFHDPSTGAITIDGIDLRELALEDLYRNIATVLQETLVFDATVRENIRWGRPDAGDDEVRAAATAADAHEFILALPQGYDTRVGQRGRLLSGGQRQRLAIARAMIRDAPVLLLDEPTTGLDAESGERVLEPLRRLMSGRTTIVISHDLRAVSDADRIVYLEHGRVAGIGSHLDLLAQVPGYARLARAAGSGGGPGDGAALVLDRVRLRGPGREDLLDEVSIDLHGGGCLAVLGPDRSACSTLLRVMAGVERPAAGTVRRDPRARTVLVADPVELVAGTIAENIRLGCPGAGPADVVAAAVAVGLQEVVNALPHAYATRVLPSGPPLGPLDVRRLVLARALLAAPDILLLDDPTAGLDRAARNTLLAVLCDVAAGRTTVIATGDPVVAAIGDRRLRLTPAGPPPTVAFHPVPRRGVRGALTRG
ncbi:MAG TPA: ABC transporter transmembrane domain-containing protein [Pseudonocardia sp.]|nr:ABC transporter transmembrane domain-containing protein [Pseudonocardia sp.]